MADQIGTSITGVREETAAAVLRAVDELREELLAFTAATVAVPSITGHEDRAQELYIRQLSGLGLELDVWAPQAAEFADLPHSLASEERFGQRSNVVGTWRGAGGGPSLALNGHFDVVPSGEESRWQYPPFSGTRAEGKIWGRGACDMKGGLASGIVALAALQRAGVRLRGDLQVQCVIAEETSGLGSIAAIRRGHVPDALICLEPTDLKIAPAMGGLAKYRITVMGKSAHTSMPWNGVSAFEKFIPIYQGVKAFEAERHESIDHPLFNHLPRKAPIAMGKIHAGEWPYSLPERLEAHGRLGMVPGDDPEALKARFEQRIQDVAMQDDWLRDHPPVVEWTHGQFEPWETSVEHPLVQSVIGASESVRQQPPAFKPITGGVDAAFFVKYCQTPSVTFGPGDMTLAHYTDEHVREDDLVTAAKVVALAALSWCGEASS